MLVIPPLLITALLGIILFFVWREPKLSDFRVQFLSLFFSGLYLTGFLSLTSVFPELIKIDEFKGVKQRNYANKGIFNSVENFIELGLIVSALSGFLIGLGGSFAWGFNHGLGLGIVGGFFWGIGYGMECSSQTCIPHFALRLVLWLSNFMPWNYRKFLDYAVHLRLLKKEGGTYIFHHPSLQEYFAEMNDDRLMEQK